MVAAACQKKNINNGHLVIRGSELLHEILKDAGVELSAKAALAVETWPNVSAYKSNPRICDNLVTIIRELRETIKTLEEVSDDPKRSQNGKHIRNAVEHLKTVLIDLKQARRVLATKSVSPDPPIDTLMTTYLGAVVGPAFGVLGAASGAIVGCAVGMAATRAGILGNNIVVNKTETDSSDIDD